MKLETIRPSSKEEFRAILEKAKDEGKLVYISANPCPECEQFESALEVLALKYNVDVSAKIVKIDTPPDDWAVEFVLEELKLSGAPVVLDLKRGEVIDDFDPVELAKKVVERVR